MPTVKFNLRDEIMKEALKVKERLGITWREATLQGLGFTVPQPKIGRPKRITTPHIFNYESLEQTISTIAQMAFREVCVARRVLPVITNPSQNDYHMSPIPVIHKSFRAYDGNEINVEKIQEKARLIAKEEDALMLTGERDDWPALGIQGLSTVDGRNIIASDGCWPDNVIEDITRTKHGDLARVLIAPHKMIDSLNKVFWRDPEHIEPPITYASFLIDQKLLWNIYASDNVYTKSGEQDSAIVFTPSTKNAYVLQAMGLTVNIWEASDANCSLRECVAPIILNPKSITEISGINCEIT